jgi:hypothetical protein
MSTNFIATKIKGLERCASDRVKQIEKLETLLAKVKGSEQGDPALVEEVNVRFAELKQSRRQEKEQMKVLKKALMKEIAYQK